MVDVKLATKELVNPVSWVRMGLAILILFGIYKFVSRPTQGITAQKGSNVQVTTINKSQRFLIPFVEVYVDQRTGQDSLGTGIRGGVRVEF